MRRRGSRSRWAPRALDETAVAHRVTARAVAAGGALARAVVCDRGRLPSVDAFLVVRFSAAVSVAATGCFGDASVKPRASVYRHYLRLGPSAGSFGAVFGEAWLLVRCRFR